MPYLPAYGGRNEQHTGQTYYHLGRYNVQVVQANPELHAPCVPRVDNDHRSTELVRLSEDKDVDKHEAV